MKAFYKSAGLGLQCFFLLLVGAGLIDEAIAVQPAADHLPSHLEAYGHIGEHHRAMGFYVVDKILSHNHKRFVQIENHLRESIDDPFILYRIFDGTRGRWIFAKGEDAVADKM